LYGAFPVKWRSIGLNSAEASKPLLILRGTGISNPFPSSGESANFRFLSRVVALPAMMVRMTTTQKARAPALGLIVMTKPNAARAPSSDFQLLAPAEMSLEVVSAPGTDGGSRATRPIWR
jgi:hypothetical protein